MSPTSIQVVAAVIFALALIHTFSTKFFEHLAHTRPTHSGVWHLLAEVEIVFGFWAMVMIVVMALMTSRTDAVAYLDARNFTEPMFVLRSWSLPVASLFCRRHQRACKRLLG